MKDVNAFVLGGHGDTMVPGDQLHDRSPAFPVDDLVKMGRSTKERIDEIVKRTRGGGGEIVALLKTGSAYYAPATSAIAMAEAYLGDQKRILPCAAYVEGKYGLDGLYVGVPVVIGAGGVEEVIEIELDEEARQNLQVSVDAVKELLVACKQIDGSLAVSILVDRNTKVITQGMTGETGTFHTRQALDYGTQMVGGVTPGKGGTSISACRCSTRLRRRSRRPARTRSVIYVPPPFAADSILEAIDAEVPLIVTHHRRHSGARHGPRQARARRLEVAADRPELPRRPHAGRVQDRHHAGQHLLEGQRRRGQPLGHAHL